MQVDRMSFMGGSLFLGVFLIGFRLFNLQIQDVSFYREMVDDRLINAAPKVERRGTVYLEDTKNDKNYLALAIDRDFNLIYAVPNKILEPKKDAKILSDLLKLDFDEVYNKLSKENDPYETIARRVETDVVKQIQDFKLPGIYFDKEQWRFYPMNNLFSHILGYVGYSKFEKKGLYGVEGFYNDILSTKNNSGLNLDAFFSQGSDLVLTIDYTLQYFACNKLKEYIEKLEIEKGSLVLMNPKSGEILALCNFPDFNPNEYSQEKDISVFNNSALFSAYEPGSIFKAITMAAGLDLNVVSPDTTYVDEGFVKFGKNIIKNYEDKVYGTQTMTGVLENSLNTGAIFVASKVGFDPFKKYVYDFGFAEKTGVDLDFETKGNFTNLNKKSDIYLATASFGQGITVSLLQMASAYSALANQGKLMKPYIVKKIINEVGDIKEIRPQVVKQVISPRASSLVTGMLVSVVKNGHAKKAGVKGYFLAGKTGTAQVHDDSGKYSDKTIHSFVGYGPVENPVFTLAIRLDNPKKAQDAAGSAAPLFGEISAFLLDYYGIPKVEK